VKYVAEFDRKSKFLATLSPLKKIKDVFVQILHDFVLVVLYLR